VNFYVHLELLIHMQIQKESDDSGLPHLRFDILEAAHILRLSRAALYERIRSGSIKVQKDGRRTFVSAAELQRYVSTRDY
jgi:excisionase family DNA binding protein